MVGGKADPSLDESLTLTLIMERITHPCLECNQQPIQDTFHEYQMYRLHQSIITKERFEKELKISEEGGVDVLLDKRS